MIRIICRETRITGIGPGDKLEEYEVFEIEAPEIEKWLADKTARQNARFRSVIGAVLAEENADASEGR